MRLFLPLWHLYEPAAAAAAASAAAVDMAAALTVGTDASWSTWCHRQAGLPNCPPSQKKALRSPHRVSVREVREEGEDPVETASVLKTASAVSRDMPHASRDGRGPITCGGRLCGFIAALVGSHTVNSNSYDPSLQIDSR